MVLGMGDAHVAKRYGVKKVACPGAVCASVPWYHNIPSIPVKQGFGCWAAERQQWSAFCTRFGAEADDHVQPLSGSPIFPVVLHP
jgi:hypothetical protein